jgi:lysophospholipase L1-like esterase
MHNRRSPGPLPGAVLPCFLACAAHAADPAYLKPGDVIVCIGDSVTASGVYEEFVQTALARLYPAAGIRILNRGRNGQDAAAGVGILRAALAEDSPTVATFMFGVNDTRWSAGDEDAKAKAFVTALAAAADLAGTRRLPLLLLRESHFSHGQAGDGFAALLNPVLDRLMAAQEAFAAERRIAVIDLQCAYKRALAAAWAKDPLYEFSPDIVHPNSAGHAAMAGELLRALGAGLPLAARDGDRGPLRTREPADLSLELADGNGVAAPGKAVPFRVTVRNRSAEREEGVLLLCVADCEIERQVDVAGSGSTSVAFEVPSRQLRAPWRAEPAYVAFRGQQRFVAASSLFFHASVRPAKKEPVVFQAADFRTFVDGASGTCSVAKVSVRRTKDELTADFTWADATPVPAKPGFNDRFGQEVRTPLNLRNREGQPCDAVEFFLDLRGVEAIGRCTSNADDNPAGVLRLGVYFDGPAGERTAKLQTPPGAADRDFELKPTGRNTWQLVTRAKPGGPVVGFSMRVTDNAEFKYASTQPFCLTGRQGVGQEPMSYVLLGKGGPGVLYRIGY